MSATPRWIATRWIKTFGKGKGNQRTLGYKLPNHAMVRKAYIQSLKNNHREIIHKTGGGHKKDDLEFL